MSQCAHGHQRIISEDLFSLSTTRMGSRFQTQVLRLGGKRHYTLSHLIRCFYLSISDPVQFLSSENKATRNIFINKFFCISF